MSDNPEWSQDDIRAARPFVEMFPELATGVNRDGSPRKPLPKQRVSVRLSPDVLDRLKSDGPGWQTQMDATLRKALGLT